MSDGTIADQPAERTLRLDYEDLAQVFSAVYAATNDIAIALEVLDAHRARAAILAPGPTLPQRVLSVAASVFNLSPSRLLRPGRHRDLCSARWVAAWILRRQAWSTTRIGRFLKLDHSTILHGLRRVATDPMLMPYVKAAEEQLTAMRATR